VEVNLQDGLLVFELEHCTGPELGTYLRKYGCLEEKEAKLIMRQLFSALHYLFKLEEKVIHYDLKPSNVMFDEGVVKMLDFGLSKVMKGDETRMDLTSQGTGTYWYLPPETFEEYNPQVSPKVDVWSLGVIFF
jgi:tousled-like kinase